MKSLSCATVAAVNKILKGTNVPLLGGK